MDIDEGWLSKGHWPVRPLPPKFYDPKPLVYALRDVVVTCIRAFYRLSACSLVTGFLGIPYGHRDIPTFSFSGTVRSRADAVRVWEYPYDLWCRALRGLLRPSGARSGYIYQAKTRWCDVWTVGARKTTNCPSIGTKSLVSHMCKEYKLKLQPRDLRHNSKFFETSCILVMHAVWFPTCLQRLHPYGTRRH